jgi:hypothetical protein
MRRSLHIPRAPTGTVTGAQVATKVRAVGTGTPCTRSLDFLRFNFCAFLFFLDLSLGISLPLSGGPPSNSTSFLDPPFV